MKGIRNISMIFIAIAQLLIIAHAVIPHHHHHDQIQTDQACCNHGHESEEGLTSVVTENHESEECCSACNALNVIISQISVDHHFIQVECDFDLAITDIKQIFYTNNDIGIISPHLLRQHLRSPPQA